MIEKGEFFRRICTAFGITPERGAKAFIARQTGNSETAIGNWEKGEIPSIDNLERIAIATNTSLHWLLTGVGPQTLDELEAAKEQIFNRADLERFVRRIVKDELNRKGAPSFQIDLNERNTDKKLG